MLHWSEITSGISAKTLRQFGLAGLVFCGGSGLVRLWLHGPSVLVNVLVSAGVVLGALGLIAPGVLKPVYLALMAVTFPIGFVMSRVLLGLMFYAVVTPIALLFRLRGRDRLKLKKPTGQTYWLARDQAEDPSSYFKQS